MSAKEANMLDELRKKELKTLTDSEYNLIRDEVASKGIRVLKGTSAQIVFMALRKREEAIQKAIVAKHGNHDQRTHGNWAGEGAGDTTTSNPPKTDGDKGSDSFQQKMLRRGMAALEKHDYKTMMADYDKMETKWRKKLDKPFDPGMDEEYGDPAELADTDFFKKYGAYPLEVTMFHETATSLGYVKKKIR